VAGSNQVVLGHRRQGAWGTDAVVARTVAPGTDCTLLAALDNAPEGGGDPVVNVVLNGTTALSLTYPFQTVGDLNQGNLKLGLLAQNGGGSFASLTIRGDDPAYAGGGTPQLAAAPAPASASALSPLTGDQLARVVTAALKRWAAALRGSDSALRQV